MWCVHKSYVHNKWDDKLTRTHTTHTRRNYYYIWSKTLLEECGGYRQGYGRIEIDSSLLKRKERTLAAGTWILEWRHNWNSGNNRVRCSPDWSVYRCIERYCMTPRQRDDDNNLSVGNRNHLKLGIEPESWLQSHELGF